MGWCGGQRDGVGEPAIKYVTVWRMVLLVDRRYRKWDDVALEDERVAGNSPSRRALHVDIFHSVCRAPLGKCPCGRR